MERNTDPKTRYAIDLACGHTMHNPYPPAGMRRIVCRDCEGLTDFMKTVLSWTDTLLDLRTDVRAAA